MKTSYIFGLLLSCLCLFACNSEPKKENIVSGNPNILPVDANTKAKGKIDLKQQQDRPANNNQAPVYKEPFEWNANTEKDFIDNCLKSTAKNEIINATKYCPCILDLLKNGYNSSELNKAVQENPDKAAACLRGSIKSGAQ